ncbi:MAG: LUD domain-containing protein [Chitinophagales bacterium]|nr:LUD domain-containing protein [Chitinophagales bacterium]
MFSEDGEFFNRIKSLLNNGKVEEQTEKVVMSTTGDILVETLEPETVKPPEMEIKEKIQAAINERPSSLVNREESITEKPIGLRTVQVSAPTATYVAPVDKELDIRFATKFIDAGGKFLFCESMKEAIETLKMLKEENGWEHVFAWENEVKDAFVASNFQKGAVGFTIENSDAAISLCECLIADEGIVILNPKQASRRRLPCFPKAHVILADVTTLIGSEAEGLEKFHKKHKGELPSFIKLGHCNEGHFYDKQRLILNAEGPEDVYVILIDEYIPPSLRP